MSDLTRVVRIHPSTLHREVDGEAVLLQLDTGEYFGLDPVGTRIWQLMLDTGSVEGIVSAVASEFAVEPDVAAADLDVLLAELVARRLVEIETIAADTPSS